MTVSILSKHAKIVLVVSIILFFINFTKWTRPFLTLIEESNFINLICFFLILTIGISHGALDHINAKKVLKIFKIKTYFIFYILYITLSILIIFLWILFPSFTLAIFLFVSCYHFGKEDSYFIFDTKKKWHNLIFLFKGLLIVAAPLAFHNAETIKIFELLGANSYFLIKNFTDGTVGQYHNNLFYLAFWGNLSFFYLSLRKKKAKIEWIYIALDGLTVVLLNIALSPLIAFTVYFCFIHSFRHSMSLINKLDRKRFKSGLKKFIKKALPLTLITALLFIMSIFFLTNYNVLDDAILKVIFIGLASLTFPHILLEYLLEKNGK